jgi:succinoglycan biosynthesis protein ExoM
MKAAIDVCVCTFRRPAVREALRSLAAQTGAPQFRVIVVDNDDEPTAHDLVNAAKTEFQLDLTYIHAPGRNISIARNACLDAAAAPLVAFLDDDEIAPPEWLARLHAHLQATSCDVVLGPVRALYAPDAPVWITKADMHSFAPKVRDNGQIDTGYSSNVLFRRSAIGALRFDVALGRSGGEDAFFFAALHRAGARLDFCADAIVSEPTAGERARLSWLLRRSFRSGQTHARILANVRGQGPVAIAVPAAAKAAYCAAITILTLWSPVRWRTSAVRGALHVGVIARAFGARDLEIYGAKG